MDRVLKRKIVVVDRVEHVFDLFDAVVIQGYHPYKQENHNDKREQEMKGAAFYSVPGADSNGHYQQKQTEYQAVKKVSVYGVSQSSYLFILLYSV
jgi:hypothetical protein